MNNRKAAKKLIKRAKCCPEYYSEAEVKYAKMIKNREKLLTKSADSVSYTHLTLPTMS